MRRGCIDCRQLRRSSSASQGSVETAGTVPSPRQLPNGSQHGRGPPRGRSRPSSSLKSVRVGWPRPHTGMSCGARSSSASLRQPASISSCSARPAAAARRNPPPTRSSPKSVGAAQVREAQRRAGRRKGRCGNGKLGKQLVRRGPAPQDSGGSGEAYGPDAQSVHELVHRLWRAAVRCAEGDKRRAVRRRAAIASKAARSPSGRHGYWTDHRRCGRSRRLPRLFITHLEAPPPRHPGHPPGRTARGAGLARVATTVPLVASGRCGSLQSQAFPFCCESVMGPAVGTARGHGFLTPGLPCRSPKATTIGCPLPRWEPEASVGPPIGRRPHSSEKRLMACATVGEDAAAGPDGVLAVRRVRVVPIPGGCENQGCAGSCRSGRRDGVALLGRRVRG